MNIEAGEKLLEMIKTRQHELGINNAELARKAGVTYAKVRFWLDEEEKRRTRMPGWDTVEAIKTALDIGEPQITIPLFGEVPAGVPLLIDEQLPEECEQISLPDVRQDWFAMRVRGQSMNRYAPEGSVIICKPGTFSAEQLDGSYVIANLRGECTFKRLRLNPLRLEPKSYDDTYEIIFPEPEELHILAEVQMVLICLKN